MSVVVSTESLRDQHDQVVSDLQGAVHPDDVRIIGGLALIATVGQGMNRRVGTAAKLFTALGNRERQHSYD